MLRSAVERQFGIIGEALSHLSRRFPATAARISQCSAIVGFRNRLIHGYSAVADPVVWNVIEADMPLLKREVDALLAELQDANS
jgi:uncharacterized protein with HEPN domain